MSEKTTKGVQILIGNPKKGHNQALHSNDDRHVSSDGI